MYFDMLIGIRADQRNFVNRTFLLTIIFKMTLNLQGQLISKLLISLVGSDN